MGRPAYELLLPPRDWPVLLQRNKQRIRGVAEHYEVELMRKDGSLFWADIHATPYRNTSGEVVGTLGAITDITERKRMEQKMVHTGTHASAGRDGPGNSPQLQQYPGHRPGVFRAYSGQTPRSGGCCRYAGTRNRCAASHRSGEASQPGRNQ